MSVSEWLETAQGLTAAIAALAAAVAAAFAKAWKAWAPIIRLAKREKRMDANHRVWHYTRQGLTSAVIRSGCDRALLLTARNCGWADPSLPVTVSVTCEGRPSPDTPSVFERWQDWRTDPAYRDMLADLWDTRESGKGLLVLTEDMAHGTLRDYYRESGVAASVVIFLRTFQNGTMMYLSLNYGCLHDMPEDVPECQLSERTDVARAFHESPERVRREAAMMRAVWKDVV